LTGLAFVRFTALVLVSCGNGGKRKIFDDGLTPVERYGALQVAGSKLCDKNGKPVQLCGMSSHGLQWYGKFANKDVIKWLRDDWNADLWRAALYTNPYTQNKNLGTKVTDSIDAAIELGMYVIVDWHILYDKTPMLYKDEACRFFDEISERLADHTNVIYEICNEPQESPFGEVIRPYAEEIIPIIRKHDKDSMIIVGTNNWSQDVDDVIGQKCSDKNVMYALHFYASTHKDKYLEKAKKALSGNVPLFISECSICDASGDGDIDYEMGRRWIDFADENDISYIVWNLSNKNESSSLIRPEVRRLSCWKDEEYSDTAKWFKKVMSDKKDS
jgi:endoglucanase